MALSDLPTLAEQAGKPRDLRKGKSRLEQKVAARPLVTVTDASFKKAVRERDGLHCRKCGRKVRVTGDHVPERAEIHHVHGRRGSLRHETRCALVLCLTCHEQVTGRVNEKFVIVATKQVVIEMQAYTDARQPVTFERIV